MANKDGLTPAGVVTGKRTTTANIARFAQGVLLLFAIASIIAGWSGNRIGTSVLTAVIVVGFMLVLLGFQRLSQSKTGYYATLGAVLTTLSLAGVVILFLTVLLYIGMGYPPWLDRFFGKETAPAPAASVEFNEVTTDAIGLRFAPYEDTRADLIVTVFEAGSTEPALEPRHIPALNDRVVLAGLKPATSYTIAVVAFNRWRESFPATLKQATDADGIPFPVKGHAQVAALYWGDLTPDLVPDGKDGRVIFRSDSGDWMYEGPVANGVLDGTDGYFRHQPSAEARACDEATVMLIGDCSSWCQNVTFSNGQLVAATCDLVLAPVQWRERSAMVVVDEGGAYRGDVKEVTRDGTASIGPFTVSYSGTGVLVAGGNRLEGSWAEGGLAGSAQASLASGEIQVGTFEDGLLKEGNVYGKPVGLRVADEAAGGETVSFDVKQFAPVGIGAWIGPRGFKFGKILNFNPMQGPASGFEGSFDERDSFFLTKTNAAGLIAERFSTTTTRRNVDCMTRETFGMDVDTFNDRWELWNINHLEDAGSIATVQRDELTLELKPADIHVTAFKEHDRPVDLRFWIGNNFATAQELSLDGQVVPANTIYREPQQRSALTFARLCFAREVTNLTNDETISLDGFCPVAAVFLARAYYCDAAVDWTSQSAWNTESYVGNWLVRVSKEGVDPDALTITGVAAEVGSTSADNYVLAAFCLRGQSTLSFGLWGPDVLQDAQNTKRDFTLTSLDGASATFTLNWFNPGVYHFQTGDYERATEILSGGTISVATQSAAVGAVEFNFDPQGAAEALPLVTENCHA